MESKICDFPDCKMPAALSCEGSHDLLNFCSPHFEKHSNEFGVHKIVEVEQCNLLKLVKYYDIISRDQVCSDTYSIISANRSVYLITFNSIEIDMPDDYQEAINKATEKFGKIISTMPAGKGEKISKKCVNYIRAMSNIIYNISIDFSRIDKRIKHFYNQLHTEIQNFISTSLLNLFEKLKKLLNMKSKATKFIIMPLILEDEMQEFIAKYLTQDEINYKYLYEDFNNTFSYFIREKNNKCIEYFKEFTESLQTEQLRIMNESCKHICNYLASLWREKSFKRLGIFSLRIFPENDNAEEILSQ